MKIEGGSMSWSITDLSLENKQKPIVSSKHESSIKNKDRFETKISAAELSHFFELVKNTEEIRTDKINEIKKEIEEKGAYQVTGRDIVLKLLEENR